MPDQRNVAHDKTVQHDKKKHGEEIVHDAAETPHPGMKPTLKHHARDEKKVDADAAGDGK